MHGGISMEWGSWREWGRRSRGIRSVAFNLREVSAVEVSEAKGLDLVFDIVLGRGMDRFAEFLDEQIGSKVTPESFRKTLQRARNKYFEMLIQELRETIHPATDEDIEDEIQALGLGQQYRRYLSQLDGD